MAMSKVDALLKPLLQGDRRALAQAITLVESVRVDHRLQAEQLLQALMPHTGHSIRLGLSGTPGVGKSTFIESFGLELTRHQRRIAVLTVDPSSTLTGGSILGDKTRMENLSRHPDAFVRSSPAGATLGGVARRTREAVLICEAAGFDVVIVETVGVGQSEIAVSQMTDTFILLLQPAAGDDLQGIKRGIMELAEIVVINKADGELKEAATRAAADYQNALSLLRGRNRHWQVPVAVCSALMGDGIENIWQLVCQHQQQMQSDGQWQRRRESQAEQWFWAETAEQMIEQVRLDSELNDRLERALTKVREKKVPAVSAARSVIAEFLASTNPPEA